jgi:hypothetical protein
MWGYFFIIMVLDQKDQVFVLRALELLIINLLLLTDLLHKEIICSINSVFFV